MDIRTEAFKAEHIIAIADRVIEPTYTPEERIELAKNNVAVSVALTAFIGDEIIGCGGIRMDSKMMWIMLSDKIKKHKKSVFWATKKLFEILTDDLELDRVKAQVAVGFAEGHRLVKHLGFEALGTQETEGFDDYERLLAWQN